MWLLALARADDPWAELRAAHPTVASALRQRTADPAAAALLLSADPRLVELLVPRVPVGPTSDLVAEGNGPDLLDADVHLEGTVLVGTVQARDIARYGAWIDVDIRGGPAADLRVGFGRGWTRVVSLMGGETPALPPGPPPRIEGDILDFSVDLGGLVEKGGAAVAMVRSLDGRYEDVGPAGVLGTPPDEGLDVLVGLVEECTAEQPCDADLAVAIAVTFGSMCPLVADDVVELVDADARAWLAYGQDIDAWLEEAGATWRLAELDALGKLVWAWPAAQAVVYGAVPLAHQRALLTAEQWRFLVPSTDTLTRLREDATITADRAETARTVDLIVNSRLRYRTHDALMRTLCEAEALSDAVCAGWSLDAKAGFDLGELAGARVPMWEGTSASWQEAVRAREGAYVGDCATATALTIATLQALGVPALGVGWSGDDLGTPTHDVPIWYDGERFYGAQGGPGRQWARERAFVYLNLPAVHPVSAWVAGREPNGWSRGGSVAGGWTSYAEITRMLRNGLPGTALGQWVDEQAVGAWPVFGGSYQPAER